NAYYASYKASQSVQTFIIGIKDVPSEKFSQDTFYKYQKFWGDTIDETLSALEFVSQEPFTKDASGVTAASYATAGLRCLAEMYVVLHRLNDHFPESIRSTDTDLEKIIGRQVSRLKKLNDRFCQRLIPALYEGMKQSEQRALDHLTKDSLLPG